MAHADAMQRIIVERHPVGKLTQGPTLTMIQLVDDMESWEDGLKELQDSPAKMVENVWECPLGDREAFVARVTDLVAALANVERFEGITFADERGVICTLEPHPKVGETVESMLRNWAEQFAKEEA